MKKQTLRFLLSGMALLCGAATGGMAADFPDHPMRVIVPYPAGGASDLFARLVADGLSKELQQPVLVENKPGAGGAVAANTVLGLPADGHTLYYTTESIHVLTPVVNDYVGRPNQMDPRKSFMPVSAIAEIPIVLSISSAIPAGNVQEFVAYAKANAGKLNYASDGIGSSTHLGGEMFKLAGKFDATHVPYKGTNDQMTGIMGGQIHFTFSSINSALTYSKQGKMKVLAIAGPKRLPQFPEVATMAEQGYPSVSLNSWHGFVVRTGTDPAIAQTLARNIQKIAASPDVLRKLEPTGLSAAASTPAEFGERIQASVRRWSEVLDRSKVKID